MSRENNKKKSREDEKVLSDYDQEIESFYDIAKNSIKATNSKYISSGSMNNNIGWSFSNEINSSAIDDIFIKITRHLDEVDLIQMLNKIKENNVSLYKDCLINVISFPNYRLMSEQFMIDFFEDYKSEIKDINFEMRYGKLLDDMPSFKLLLNM
jgi:hypothetical protein